METNETPSIALPTKCKLCPHIFKSDLLRDAAILGDNPHAKLKQIEALMKPILSHIEKNHPEAIQEAQMAGGNFAGYLTMLLVDMDADTQKKLGMDFTRWKIRQLTTRKEMHVSDEKLDARITSLLDRRFNDEHFHTTGLDVQKSLLHEDIYALMKQLRDVLEERGRYTESEPS